MERLDGKLPVPILHDDHYGMATVITAAFVNALKLTNRVSNDLRVVVNGAGAAGAATIAMLEALGVGDIVAVDRCGILSKSAEGCPNATPTCIPITFSTALRTGWHGGYSFKIEVAVRAVYDF